MMCVDVGAQLNYIGAHMQAIAHTDAHLVTYSALACWWISVDMYACECAIFYKGCLGSLENQTKLLLV